MAPAHPDRHLYVQRLGRLFGPGHRQPGGVWADTSSRERQQPHASDMYCAEYAFSQRAIDSLFQSISVRTAGFSITTLSALAPAVQLLWVLVFY